MFKWKNEKMKESKNKKEIIREWMRKMENTAKSNRKGKMQHRQMDQ